MTAIEQIRKELDAAEHDHTHRVGYVEQLPSGLGLMTVTEAQSALYRNAPAYLAALCDLAERIAEIHQNSTMALVDYASGPYCMGCGHDWPCPTTDALNDLLPQVCSEDDL